VRSKYHYTFQCVVTSSGEIRLESVNNSSNVRPLGPAVHEEILLVAAGIIPWVIVLFYFICIVPQYCANLKRSFCLVRKLSDFAACGL